MIACNLIILCAACMSGACVQSNMGLLSPPVEVLTSLTLMYKQCSYLN